MWAQSIGIPHPDSKCQSRYADRVMNGDRRFNNVPICLISCFIVSFRCVRSLVWCVVEDAVWWCVWWSCLVVRVSEEEFSVVAVCVLHIPVHGPVMLLTVTQMTSSTLDFLVQSLEYCCSNFWCVHTSGIPYIAVFPFLHAVLRIVHRYLEVILCYKYLCCYLVVWGLQKT